MRKIHFILLPEQEKKFEPHTYCSAYIFTPEHENTFMIHAAEILFLERSPFLIHSWFRKLFNLFNCTLATLAIIDSVYLFCAILESVRQVKKELGDHKIGGTGYRDKGQMGEGGIQKGCGSISTVGILQISLRIPFPNM